jgi:hypothetical protein
MSSELTQRRPTPKPPAPSHIVAVLLEWSIVAVLASHHSVTGLVLAFFYAWFSATWALFARSGNQ